MSDTTDTTVASETSQETAKDTSKDNDTSRSKRRGIVGPHNMKGLFHSFQRREGRKSHKSRSTSLKVFAHQLAETGNDEEREIALKWLANKAGAQVKKEKELRQKNKGATLVAIRLASKNARRK